MIGTRIMPGLENLEGRTFGTLRIGRMVERHPQPRYSTTCSLCSAQSTETNSRLVNGTARCRNGGCGKLQRRSGRELLAEQRRQTAEREAQRRAEDLEASESRMAAECDADGYERPTKYAPTPSRYQPMTERERLALRERREAEEQERIEADRPRLEAERKAAEEQKAAKYREQERIEKQRTFWAEWVQNDRDPKLHVSAAMRSASMPQAEVDTFNESEVKTFTDTNEYVNYRTAENTERILQYLHLNGIKIVDAETLQAAFVRLRELGILEKKPAPQPVEEPRQVNLAVAPSQPQTPPGPKIYVGRDYATGRDREFTQREVNRMSSAEYARAFEVTHTVSEWLTQINKSR